MAIVIFFIGDLMDACQFFSHQH